MYFAASLNQSVRMNPAKQCGEKFEGSLTSRNPLLLCRPTDTQVEIHLISLPIVQFHSQLSKILSPPILPSSFSTFPPSRASFCCSFVTYPPSLTRYPSRYTSLRSTLSSIPPVQPFSSVFVHRRFHRGHFVLLLHPRNRLPARQRAACKRAYPLTVHSVAPRTACVRARPGV